MDEQHISNRWDLEIALKLMEGDHFRVWESLKTAGARRSYHDLHAHSDEDWAREFIDNNHVCGESIYGSGGWHRYYLRADGYVYFSKFHATEEAIQDAEALGFRAR